MAPKKAAATKAAATKGAAKDAATTMPKANTKAKVTKPAPSTKDKKTAATTVAKAPAKGKTAAAKKTEAAEKAPAAKAARGRPKKDAAEVDTKTTATKTKAKEATSVAAPKTKATKRKSDDDDESAQPAKKVKTTTKSDAEEVAAAPVKKTKALAKGKVINEPPTQLLNVFVFGEGTAGELGLGTTKKDIDVKRPRLNPNLAADKVGVVQVVGGGMHVIALTKENKILTWGVNDQGALGRDTTWDGGLKDMDANEDSDSEDEDDTGMNPKESIPGEVDFSNADVPEGTRWVQVSAGDSCSFALTDDGRVYGWGTFRSNEGVLGFFAGTHIAERPMLIPDLKNVTSIKSGANHTLALDTNGAVYAWGSGQQNQLGRRVVERTKLEGLKPREFGLPKGAKKGITTIETGAYHSFAISKTGAVYGWGLNNFGETGIPDNAGEDDAVVLKPRVIEAFKDKQITSIKGGGHHSVAATSDGDCLVWGRLDGNQLGLSSDEVANLPEDAVIKDERGVARIVTEPVKVTAIKGKVNFVTSSSDHNVVITEEGKAWSWGFSANYQTGQGTTDDILVATLIDNTAVRERKLTGATTGGQYSVVYAAAESTKAEK